MRAGSCGVSGGARPTSVPSKLLPHFEAEAGAEGREPRDIIQCLFPLSPSAAGALRAHVPKMGVVSPSVPDLKATLLVLLFLRGRC